MRIVAAIALAAGFCFSAMLWAQDSDEPPVTVHSLAVHSSDLSAADQAGIVQKFQGGKYVPGELVERVRRALRDQGYYKAACSLDGVKDSDDGLTADIALSVTAGAQYWISRIAFTGASAFPAAQLRALFPVADGALYSASAIGRGLDRMMGLYEEQGYLDLGAVPSGVVDEVHRTVALTIDVDQGKVYYFGRLLLDGAEPKAGAAQSLQDAWASLRQKPYSPKLLNDWLREHAPYWPGEGQPIDHVSLAPNGETQLADVVLQFP